MGTDEHGDCALFARCLAKACEKMGMRFVYSAEVTALKTSAAGAAARDDGDVVSAAVLANGEEISGDLFVVALGSQSPRLVRSLGIDLPIYPIKGYSLELPTSLAKGS